MPTCTLPACPATGSPRVQYRVTPTEDGPLVRRRSGTSPWEDVGPTMLREALSAPTDLAAWLRSQGVRGVRGAVPRDAEAGPRSVYPVRISDRARRGLAAEAQRAGISVGEMLTRLGESYLG